ncbi:MAG: thioredoxin [Clostridia bacterium]|nr:thioredoxin [Clostridia bacterium]
MAVRINADSFEAEVLQSDIPVLADFYSDSCVPCKRLSPVLAEVEEEYTDSIKVVKININFDTELAERYEVQAAPTLILYKDGKEADRLRGAIKKADIVDLITK